MEKRCNCLDAWYKFLASTITRDREAVTTAINSVICRKIVRLSPGDPGARKKDTADVKWGSRNVATVKEITQQHTGSPRVQKASRKDHKPTPS